mmetsp:Transcript_14021/g.21694  ORF Transcript_14021/g.21694 Transcript_14021/m.21694 type:complete len:410 (+) Transcript_14021:91-1320(+)
MAPPLLRQAVVQSRLAARRLSRRAATTTHQQPQRAMMMCTTSATSPLYAQPNQYVTGVTNNQMEANQAMRDWYTANFPSWEDDPETIIATEDPSLEINNSATATATTDDESSDKGEEITTNPHAITLPPELTKRNIRPLVGYLRDPDSETGTRNCDRLRNPTGPTDDDYFPLVPGILHGSDPSSNILSIDSDSKLLVKTPWFEIQRELDRYASGRNGSFENRVYALTIFPSEDAYVGYHQSVRKLNHDGTTYQLDEETMEVTETPGTPPEVLPERTPIVENVLVIPADLQLHPVAHSALCVNFIRYHAKKPIKIPIRSVNEEESPAMKRGGFIAFVNTFVECLVEEGGVIPERIELECSGLRQKDVVRRERLIIPEGVVVHPRVKDDFLVGTVFGAKGLGADDEEEEGE